MKKLRKRKRSGSPPEGAVYVRIHTNSSGGLEVTPDSAGVKKIQEAEWMTTGNIKGQPFTVYFDGESPFADWYFTQDNPRSGTPLVPSSKKPYKYTVMADGQVLDPEVIIDP